MKKSKLATKRLSVSEKRARVVPARIKAGERAKAIDKAISKIKTSARIDFVRSVRGNQSVTLPGPRRPAARGVYSFEDPGLFLPKEVVLDSSFVVAALLPRQPHHRAARSFLGHLADEASTFYFNRLLETELVEAAFQIGLRERHPKDWKRRRHDGRARRHASQVLDQVLETWSEVLAAVTWVRIEVGEVFDLVPRLVKRHGLASYDAVHTATALYVGVRDLATLDAGFSALPASILTLHVSRPRACVPTWRATAEGRVAYTSV